MNNSTFAAATAHWLPIISTRGETLERFFLHRENVFLCPPCDLEALVAAIQTLIDRAEPLLSVGQQTAARAIRERFSRGCRGSTTCRTPRS
ncbi:MAG TPA: hypothetical protein VKB81_07965 [Nitrospira sp.]|nr:hypothetical protein [Nitrospira sp.]